MNEQYDDDGDSIVLTEDDRAHIKDEIGQLDAELVHCRDSSLFRDIRHRRTHLASELMTGRRIPMPEDNSTWYDFQIVPREAELGGGWRLYRLRNGREVGGGEFPVLLDEVAGAAWWSSFGEAEKALWLGRATVPTAAGAYLAYLTDQAWHDAAQVAGEWLDSRPAD